MLGYVDGMNLYAGRFVNSGLDPSGLALNHYYALAGKSYINTTSMGSLWWRTGAGLFPFSVAYSVQVPGSYVPWLSNARLAFFWGLSYYTEAFNQNPTNDYADGKYRLYTKISISFCCSKSKMKNFKVLSTNTDSGVELQYQGAPIAKGSIFMEYNIYSLGESGVRIDWEGWGRPNDIIEPIFQWVGIRTSKNIWHHYTLDFRCVGDGVSYEKHQIRVSRFPSHKLFLNGDMIDYQPQGVFSDLWFPDPSRSTFVIPK